VTRAAIERLLQELAATRQHLEETSRILREHFHLTDKPAPPTGPARR
jgi:hypothetical protein